MVEKIPDQENFFKNELLKITTLTSQREVQRNSNIGTCFLMAGMTTSFLCGSSNRNLQRH